MLLIKVTMQKKSQRKAGDASLSSEKFTFCFAINDPAIKTELWSFFAGKPCLELLENYLDIKHMKSPSLMFWVLILMD